MHEGSVRFEGEPVFRAQEEECESEPKKRYGYLIVFGFGAKPRTIEEAEADPDREEDIGWHLPVGTKARVLAAGELWRMGEIDKIVMSEGKGPDKEKSGGELMREYLLAKYPEIPDDNVIVEDRATNTIENFAGTVNFLDESNIHSDKAIGSRTEATDSSNVAFLSNRFHMARIKNIAEKFGFKGDGFAAEDVLGLAASQKIDKKGNPYSKRFDIWNYRMSNPEGNDVWRDPNEVARRHYLKTVYHLISGAKANKDEEKVQEYTSFLSKVWHPELRLELDQSLADLGVDVEALHHEIEEEIKRMGKTSYRDYLRQENRWSQGMNEVPEYWLFQVAKVNSVRFRKILQDPLNIAAVKTLEDLGYNDPLNMGEEDFEKMRQTVSSDDFIKQHRKLPPQEWEGEY
jgi:uncharacterized SAM-binding protein YcdF (DUF218 family)